MAVSRNTGAVDLGGSAVGAGGLAPGAVSASGLQGSNPIDFQAAIDGAVLNAQLPLPPIDPANRFQVQLRQIELRDKYGVDLKVDGVYGDVTKWWEAMVNNGTVKPKPAPTSTPPPPPPAPAPRAASGGGRVAPAAAPAAVSVPAERTTPKALPMDWIDQARAQFPALAGLLDVPEIRGIVQEALQWEWPSEKLTARFQNSEWFKATPAAKRQWIGLLGTDPASAAKILEEQKATIRRTVRDYHVMLSDDVIGQYAEKVVTGDLSADALTDEFKNLAKSHFPALAAYLDQGLTVQQAADPYVQLAAKELEIPDTAINLDDPKWSRPLQQVGGDGKPMVMTLYDWQKTLRSDDTYGWDRTSGARQQAAQFSQQLAQTFGRA